MAGVTSLKTKAVWVRIPSQLPFISVGAGNPPALAGGYFMIAEKKQCKYCKVTLVIGQAIESKDGKVKECFSYYDDGKLILCWKCPECGYSED